MKDFRRLKVWERSHRLTLQVYVHTRSFPKDELYGLTAQIRRAAVSIGANIAEGVDAEVMLSSVAFCRSQWVRPVSWNTTFCWRAI